MDEVVDHPRPWIEHYPDGIRWDVTLNLTPVHEQVLAACAKHPVRPRARFPRRQDVLRRARPRHQRLRRRRCRPNTASARAAASRCCCPIRRSMSSPITPCCSPAARWSTATRSTPCTSSATSSGIPAPTSSSRSISSRSSTRPRRSLHAGHIKSIIVCHFPAALPPLKRLLFSLAKRRDLARIASSPSSGIIRWYHHLVARGGTPRPVAIDATNDVAVQQYTGGTTGLPKGAMLSHANIAANMSQIDAWGCGLFYPPSKVVAVLPFFHIFAMTVCMNVPLCNGTPVRDDAALRDEGIPRPAARQPAQRPARGADADPGAGQARPRGGEGALLPRGRCLGWRTRCRARCGPALAPSRTPFWPRATA